MIANADSQADRIYSLDGVAPALASGGGGGGAKTGLILDPGKIISRAHGYDRGGIRENGICLRGPGQHDNDFVIDENSRIRKLTPLECERLQGFPDGWTEFGVDGEKISDTQRYKCLGNAVTVPVVRAIAEKLEEENRKISKTQRKKKEERK